MPSDVGQSFRNHTLRSIRPRTSSPTWIVGVVAFQTNTCISFGRVAASQTLWIRAVWINTGPGGFLPAERRTVTLNAVLLLVTSGTASNVSLRMKAVKVSATWRQPAIGRHRVRSHRGARRRVAFDANRSSKNIAWIVGSDHRGDARPDVAVDAECLQPMASLASEVILFAAQEVCRYPVSRMILGVAANAVVTLKAVVFAVAVAAKLSIFLGRHRVIS